jgi:hypothetical protein
MLFGHKSVSISPIIAIRNKVLRFWLRCVRTSLLGSLQFQLDLLFTAAYGSVPGFQNPKSKGGCCLMKVKCALLLLLSSVACVSCKRAAIPASPANAAAAAHDYKVPYLTDDNVQRLIQSMGEAQNPFDAMFTKGSAVPGTIPGQVAALDAFARKYGFQGYQDYMAVWGRIAVGEMTIMTEGMKTSIRDSTQKNIQNAQEQLKNPNLSPDMRKVYEQQVTAGQQELQNLDKPSTSSLNDNDLALVRKYQPQIDAASQKYNKRPVQGQ